jgi:hypothetical protein
MDNVKDVKNHPSLLEQAYQKGKGLGEFLNSR